MIEIYIYNNFVPEKVYIINLLFRDFLGIEVEIKFHDDKTYKIILGENKELIFMDAFFSNFEDNSNYLLKENVPDKALFTKNQFIVEENIPIIFGNSELEITKNKIICGNDIFAASFFMLTRWEEYAVNERDEHNRFPDNLNFLKKNNIHFRPIVNEFLEMLVKMIKHFKKDFFRKENNYKLIITHDIDKFRRYDSIKKYFSAIGGDLLLRKKPFLIYKTTFEYISYILKFKNDPYDSFDFLMDISEKYNSVSRFYFIPSEKKEYDARYSINCNKIKKTIKRIKERNHIIGLHAAYNSYNNNSDFTKELKRLKKTLFEINEGRQHYLRFDNPLTWQIWEDNKLKIDSSIGFDSDGGFRSGVCFDYPVFNIISRKKLNLIERPLIAMETAIKIACKNPEDFYNRFISLSKIVKKYKGNFVFLWHNNNFNIFEWKNYATLYEKIISELK